MLLKSIFNYGSKYTNRGISQVNIERGVGYEI